MNITEKIWLDNGTPNLEFSLIKQRFLIEDENNEPIGLPERLAVTPMDIDQVYKFTGSDKHDISILLRELWTQDLVENYKSLHNEI